VRWKHGKKYRKSEGVISQQMMDDAVNGFGVELRGGGRDEAPQVYRKLEDVLSHHAGTIEVKQWLKPVGVAMAGDEIDPYKD
jgi:tRNA-splicing ligase RtcB